MGRAVWVILPFIFLACPLVVCAQTALPSTAPTGELKFERIITAGAKFGEAFPGKPPRRLSEIWRVRVAEDGDIAFMEGAREERPRREHPLGIWRWSQGHLTQLIDTRHLPGLPANAPMQMFQFGVGMDGRAMVSLQSGIWIISPGVAAKAIALWQQHAPGLPADEVFSLITWARLLPNGNVVADARYGPRRQRTQRAAWVWAQDRWRKIVDIPNPKPDAANYSSRFEIDSDAQGNFLYPTEKVWSWDRNGRSFQFQMRVGQDAPGLEGERIGFIDRVAVAADGTVAVNAALDDGGLFPVSERTRRPRIPLGPVVPTPPPPRGPVAYPREGLWIVPPNGTPKKVWVQGDESLPGIGDLAFGEYPAFDEVAPGGFVEFVAGITRTKAEEQAAGPAASQVHSFAYLFAGWPGKIELVAAEGKCLPGLPPGNLLTHLTMGSIHVNSKGQIVFLAESGRGQVGISAASLHGPGFGPGSGTKLGLWGGTPGNLRLLLETGMTLPVSPSTSLPVIGIDVAAEPLGEDGSMVVSASFDDETRALYRVRVP